MCLAQASYCASVYAAPCRAVSRFLMLAMAAARSASFGLTLRLVWRLGGLRLFHGG